MRQCDHCGSQVTPGYWRVFSVHGTLQVCPHCEDRSVKAYSMDEYGSRL